MLGVLALAIEVPTWIGLAVGVVTLLALAIKGVSQWRDTSGETYERMWHAASEERKVLRERLDRLEAENRALGERPDYSDALERQNQVMEALAGVSARSADIAERSEAHADARVAGAAAEMLREMRAMDDRALERHRAILDALRAVETRLNGVH